MPFEGQVWMHGSTGGMWVVTSVTFAAGPVKDRVTVALLRNLSSGKVLRSSVSSLVANYRPVSVAGVTV